MTAVPRLRMRGIVKRFGATLALGGVDLDVFPGEIHVLLGQNGAGKSTLMKVLAGAEPPDAGSIELDGTPLALADPLAARRAGVAMIYQELSLVNHLTVAENLFLGVEPTRGLWLDRALMRRRAREILGSLGHGAIEPDATVGSLPLGTRQVIEIARALTGGSRVLVLDEPTSSLGRPDVDRLFGTIRRLAAEGQAIVYISHFLEEAVAIGHRYTVLRDGRSVAVGPVEPGPGWLEAVITAMIGRTGAVTTSRGRRAPGEVILEVENLAGQPTPTQASLTVRRGEVVGIFGLVGSGRTELARAIFGLDRIGGGVVTVRGQPVSRRAGPTTRWRAGVGMVSEDRNRDGLAIRLSVADNVMLSKLGAGDLSLVTRGRQRRAVAPWIERLAVQVADLFQPISSLSGGNQQKVALARLLHHDVDLWILDEPTRGIDVGSKATIYQLIGELVGRPERPKAVLMISGDLRELLGLCDRIAVMHRGELGPLIEVSDADEHALLKAATGGAAA